MIEFKQKQYSEEDKKLFINFLGVLTGWGNKAKNLHWAAPSKNIHVYLDEFYEILGEYTDGLAEGYMGILGKMGPSDVRCIECGSENAWEFIDEVMEKTHDFYNNLPDGIEFKGITSECETFIQNISKYHYLFGLCKS